MAEAVGGGAAALLDVDRMQSALDVVTPELEEFVQLRIIGGEVEFLPDEGLEQRGMVRHAVDDLGGGEPVPPRLQLVEGHAAPRDCCIASGTQACRDNSTVAIEKHSENRVLAAAYGFCCQRPGVPRPGVPLNARPASAAAP